jgi:prefoldin subunit 5
LQAAQVTALQEERQQLAHIPEQCHQLRKQVQELRQHAEELDSLLKDLEEARQQVWQFLVLTGTVC